MPSRRACLAALTSAFAGCTTGAWRSHGVEPRPTDHPAVAWAVRLPEPGWHLTMPDPGAERLYVGAGDRPMLPWDQPNRDGTGLLIAIRTADGSGAWSTPTDAPLADRPVAHRDRIYAVTGYASHGAEYDNRLVAFDRNGRRRWATDPQDERRDVVAAGGDAVFVGTDDDEPFADTLFAYGRDGDDRWGQDAGTIGRGRFVDGRLLHSPRDGGLAAHDPADGTVQWGVDDDPVGTSTTPIAVFEGRCFTQPETGTGDGDPLVARSTADGTEQWRYAPSSGGGEAFYPSGVAATPGSTVGTGGTTRFVATGSNGAYGLDGSGRKQWTFATDRRLVHAPVVGDAVYLADEEGTVYGIDPADGSERWRTSFGGSLRPLPGPDGDVVVFSTGPDRQVVTSIGPEGDERWRYETSETVLLEPTVGEERVYAPVIGGTLGEPATLRGSLLALEA